MTNSSQPLINSPQNFQIAKAFDDMLHQCQRIKPAEMKQLQDTGLRNILLHAYKTTPFYTRRLAPLFAKGDIADLSRWDEVPFLTREDLQENFDTLKSTACPPSHGEILIAKSSGSTAEPVKVLKTRFTHIAAKVAVTRGMRWNKIDYALTQAQIIGQKDGNSIAYPGIKMDAPWSPYWVDNRSSGDWFQLDHETSHDLQLAWLAQRGHCYLNTMAGNAQQLAMLIAQHPKLKIELAGIQTLGERVTIELRQQVRDGFDCEIYDNYSSREFGCIATQCSHNTNLHVADELYLLEIIDDKTGLACEPGDTGSVVITSFYNQAMPLIRYKIGDLATLGAPCACGRGLTVLNAITGRSRQLFRFPGGKTSMPSLSTVDFINYLKARKWQAAQVDDTVIEIRFVSDAPEADQDRAGFIAAANKHFPLKLTYVFKQVDAIANLPSGKFFEYICELPDNET